MPLDGPDPLGPPASASGCSCHITADTTTTGHASYLALVAVSGAIALRRLTDLPEGEVVYLQPVATTVGDGDGDFEGEDRQPLLRALDEGIAAARADDHVDADDFVRELLARK